MSRIRRRVDAYYRSPSITLCSLYPIICCAALTTILWPRTWLICHTVMHLSFTVGAVAFHQLCLRYVDSEVSYMKETDCVAVTINTPPCCCCCLCLPAMVPSKGKFCILRYMVWQMPFVQGSIMLVLNVIFYKEQVSKRERKWKWKFKRNLFFVFFFWQDLYQSVLIYFIPFLVCSILMGIWALNIVVRMVMAIHADYNLMVSTPWLLRRKKL